MHNARLYFIIFAVAAVLQLYVPISIIWQREHLLSKGKIFTFKTAPVDPKDPFRGKYVTLEFDAREIKITDIHKWKDNETVYVTLLNNKQGYAIIDSIFKQKPVNNTDYIKASVDYISTDSILYINYPFKRYYMEESKAPRAEELYASASRDTSMPTIALVAVQDGNAVLKDVWIGGLPISERIKHNR